MARQTPHDPGPGWFNPVAFRDQAPRNSLACATDEIVEKSNDLSPFESCCAHDRIGELVDDPPVRPRTAIRRQMNLPPFCALWPRIPSP